MKMNRSKNDDSGFYNLKAVESEDGFFLIYESGLARIRNDGTVVWHNRLYWDDMFDRSDDSFLYYSSEHREEGEKWRIQTEDGRVVDGW